MNDNYSELAAYYASGYELTRLSNDQAHSIEFLTTFHFLTHYLPSRCTVLDCCAGGGVYAFPLAEADYEVTAGDLVRENVTSMNDHNQNGLLKCIYQGDALAMPQFPDGSFDAVLCMGALYHLQEQADREKCLGECLRVLKPGGIFVFSYINRNAVYIYNFKNKTSDINTLELIWKTGNNGLFYTMDFNESSALAEKFSLKKITDIGVDGLAYPLIHELNTASPEEFQAYMKVHLATCEQPSIIGHSMHGLWIGRKQEN